MFHRGIVCRRSVSRLAAGLLGMLVLAGGCAQSGQRKAEAPPPAPMTENERQLAIQSFDQMWETIRDYHFDPKYNGVDWEAVRAEFRPRVEAAVTMAEARDQMNGAIGRLGQSHFGVISSDSYAQPDDAEPKGESGSSSDSKAPTSVADELRDRGRGSTGIHARVSEGKAYVFRVDEGSAAAAAGVMPGWRIEKVDGRAIEPSLVRIAEAFEGQAKQQSMTTSAANAALSGSQGDAMKIEFAQGSRRVTKTVTLQEPAGDVAEFGYLPPMRLQRDATTLPSGVGYLTFSLFMEPGSIMPWFGEHITAFRQANAPGIIIDLRGNIGGIGAMSMGMGNWFVEKPNLKLGTMITRQMSLNFVLNPRPDGYRGPVAILVDELSMSTSEILAGGLQAVGRARVFGVRSPGMALPSNITKLPNGDGFQYATANYISADGNVLEGRGVIPDQEVPLDPQALLEGRDAVLEAAEGWILAQNRSGS